CPQGGSRARTHLAPVPCVGVRPKVLASRSKPSAVAPLPLRRCLSPMSSEVVTGDVAKRGPPTGTARPTMGANPRVPLPVGRTGGQHEGCDTGSLAMGLRGMLPEIAFWLVSPRCPQTREHSVHAGPLVPVRTPENPCM